jgi:hypothetical protein
MEIWFNKYGFTKYNDGWLHQVSGKLIKYNSGRGHYYIDGYTIFTLYTSNDITMALGLLGVTLMANSVPWALDDVRWNAWYQELDWLAAYKITGYNSNTGTITINYNINTNLTRMAESYIWSDSPDTPLSNWKKCTK